MFIEQINNKNYRGLLYLPIPLGFLALMIFNFIFSQGVDTDKTIQDTIALLGVNTTFVLLVAPLSFGCLMLLFWVKFVHNQSLVSLTTSRSSIDWKRVVFSFSLWSLVTIITTMIAYFLEPENFVFNFKLIPFLIFFVLAIFLIPLQTSFEEYLFRGYLMQGIGVATKSKLIPLVITSVLFGILHIANPEVEKLGFIIMIYYIGTGFFLGIVTLMDEGLELSLGFHAANNLVGALLVTADWTAFQTHSVLKDISTPAAGFDVIIPVFIIFPILLYLFSKKYKWINWKEKLTGTFTTSTTN